MAELQKLSIEELKRLREEIKREASADNAATAGQDSVSGEGEGAAEEKSSKVIRVNIADDKMSATVTLSVPSDGERYTVPEIVGALRKERVVLGIQTTKIMDMVSGEIYEEPVEVAVGREVTPGQEGYYEFAVDLSEHRKPEIREDGGVDYSAMGRLSNIAEGELIATYYPAVQGEKGYNVNGAELLAKYAKEQPQLRGKHISYNEETRQYFATASGKISCNNFNVEILTVHEVNGDLDMTSGNVEFYGDIIINGNVESGVFIRAGRNITVNGTIAAARIQAGGDIVLAKGIQGNNKGKISARGNVFAEFIEYATVEAGKDVQANSIIDSQVSAVGKVMVKGSKGVVRGGYVHGLQGVSIRSVGNSNEPKTILHCGFTEDDHMRFILLNKKANEIKDEIAKVVDEMSELLNVANAMGVTADQKARIYELNKIKGEKCQDLDRNSQEKKRLSERMALGFNSCIEISNDIFTNTVIAIDLVSMRIPSYEAHCRYVNKDGVIERRAYLGD
ncbi:MAG: FapA family protein [Lachnospiraceae bacterium]|nr:FapA family protein [Lachnospiraceae bacterium]